MRDRNKPFNGPFLSLASMRDRFIDVSVVSAATERGAQKMGRTDSGHLRLLPMRRALAHIVARLMNHSCQLQRTVASQHAPGILA